MAGERMTSFRHPTDECRVDDVRVSFRRAANCTQIGLTGGGSQISFIKLRWQIKVHPDALFLGDAWERSYGDLQWRTGDPGRIMPWYFYMDDNSGFHGFGVKVRCGALSYWTADPGGVTLNLDVRSGGLGVRLRGRRMVVAIIACGSYRTESFLSASRAFCSIMCNDPIFPPCPVYGGNNWYYAYGSSSREAIWEDCRLLAYMTRGLKNRPFMVIDDGWQPGKRSEAFNGGPWSFGNKHFNDMESISTAMRSLDVRPGIWFRPLQNSAGEIEESWYLKRPGAVKILDPTIPEAMEIIRKDTRRFSDWGFELLKHDFTFYDIFGKWGFEANPWPAGNGWTFYDDSRTSAEIIGDLYREIRSAANGALILGCNTIGHLGAGQMHIVRTGDDTSGTSWERTRKMGVNTLAFRMGQHGTFFDIDGDCVGVTGAIPWTLNGRWAELLARSGTPLFASIKPGALSPGEEMEMREFYRIASIRSSTGEAIDLTRTTTPSLWKVNDQIIEFDWYLE